MGKVDLSIIIPAYLEEENLRVLLLRLKKTLANLTLKSEVLVIDTMEPMDNTKMVCEEFGATYINRQKGNLYGDSVRTGIIDAKGEWTIFMDADGSHSPEFIKELIKHKDSSDVVIASRYVKGGGSDNSKILIIMSLIVNMVFSILFNLKCKDVSNSFKLYRTAALKELKLSSNNFEIIEEILIKLKRNNKAIKIKEVPCFFKERMFGHTKRNLFAYVFSYLIILIKLKLMK